MDAARAALNAVNPDVSVVAVHKRLEDFTVVGSADVVLDCSDNFATRHAINRACVKHRKPLVSGAALRFDAQLAVFDLSRKDSPCYSCVFPEDARVEEVQCSTMGVFAPLTGVIGAMQAMEALKLSGSYLYVSNEGTATFGVQNNLALSPTPLPISDFDNSKQQYFNLKGVWNYNKNWSFTGGYSYLMYKHNDIATDGYTYALPAVRNTGAGGIVPSLANSTSLSYLNGYDAFTNGHSNIFYMTVTYRFDAPPLPAPAMRVAEAPAPVARPAPTPPPPPAPAPPPPAPRVQKMTLDSRVLFDFDKAVLKPDGKAAIDSQIVGKLTQIQKLEVVLVTGHTDRLGTDAHNQPLSLRRADAVRDYLVSKGVPRDKIETLGMGEKQPLPGVQCDQKNLKELIACLQPNRRVEVEVKGESTK